MDSPAGQNNKPTDVDPGDAALPEVNRVGWQCDRVTVQETCLWSHGDEIRRTSDSQERATTMSIPMHCRL